MKLQFSEQDMGIEDLLTFSPVQKNLKTDSDKPSTRYVYVPLKNLLRIMVLHLYGHCLSEQHSNFNLF